MLLQMQKPGLSYAASARDWRERFDRTPKEDSRPLLILWPFGPVAFVYDVLDTEGEPLPKDVASFFARGPIDDTQQVSFISLMKRKGIEWLLVDAGDQKAGSIRVTKYPSDCCSKQKKTRHKNLPLRHGVLYTARRVRKQLLIN